MAKEAGPVARIFGGIGFSLCGLLVFYLSAFGYIEKSDLNYFVGTLFLLAGIMILGDVPILRSRLPGGVRELVRPVVLGSIIAITLGVMVILLAFLGEPPDGAPSGRPAAFLAGLSFTFAGVSILMNHVLAGSRHRYLAGIVGILCLVSLLGVPVAIYFHE